MPSDGKRPDGAARLSAAAAVGPFVSAVRFQPSPPLEPGCPLGDRFIIQRLLGTGRFARVYLAHDKERSQDVALKVVELGPCCDETAVEQLRAEVALHSRISDHRHVIQIFDVHRTQHDGAELLLLSMEQADGGDFRGWLNEHREDRKQRLTGGLKYFKQACRGAMAAHEAGLIHRDIKPENMLFVKGVLKVSDFGVSRAVQNLQSLNTSVLEAMGRGYGTPAYMAPEFFTAAYLEDLDARADIYSLCCVLYEILYPKCRPPFGGSYERLRDLHLHTEPSALPDPESIPARVAMRGLQKKPEDRFATVEELLGTLEGRIPLSPATVHAHSDSDKEDAQRRGKELWQQAQEQVSGGRPVEAMKLCRNVLACVPNHAGAREMLAQLEERQEYIRKYYTEIKRKLGSQSLREEIAVAQNVLRLFPGHPDAAVDLANLEERAKECRLSIEMAHRAYRENNFDRVGVWLEQARTADPESPRIRWALTQLANIRYAFQESNSSTDPSIRDFYSRSLGPGYQELERRLIEMLNC
jgi:serine/threonine protein kinase